MIDEREFWQLIDRSRAAAGGEPWAQSDELRAMLSALSREDLVSFARIYDSLQRQAYHWDVWAAGYLLATGMSDEAFGDFREWLISRGERVFRLAIDDPDALVDEVSRGQEDDLSAEGLWFVAHELYDERFGEEMPFLGGTILLEEPAGTPWQDDPEGLKARFPRLWTRMSDGERR